MREIDSRRHREEGRPGRRWTHDVTESLNMLLRDVGHLAQVHTAVGKEVRGTAFWNGHVT